MLTLVDQRLLATGRRRGRTAPCARCAEEEADECRPLSPSHMTRGGVPLCTEIQKMIITYNKNTHFSLEGVCHETSALNLFPIRLHVPKANESRLTVLSLIPVHWYI